MWALIETNMRGFLEVHLLSNALKVIHAIKGDPDWSIDFIMQDIIYVQHLLISSKFLTSVEPGMRLLVILLGKLIWGVGTWAFCFLCSLFCLFFFRRRRRRHLLFF